MKKPWLLILPLVVVLLSSCYYIPPQARRLSQADLIPHKISKLVFQDQVGAFQRTRGRSWESHEDPRHIRITYTYTQSPSSKDRESVTVQTSNLILDVAFQSKKHHFVDSHPGATISASATRAAQPYFPGWRVVVFDYDELVTVAPPTEDGKPRPLFTRYQVWQPRRILLAARSFHKQTVFIETSPLYEDWLTGFLPAVAQFSRDLFPHQ